MKRVILTIEVFVENEQALTEYAKEQYKAAWFDDEWEPKDVGDAALEAVALSNENPSPDTIGIAFGEASYTISEVDPTGA